MQRINSLRLYPLLSLILCLFPLSMFSVSPSLGDGIPVGSWSVRSGFYQVREPGQNAYYLTDSPMLSGKGEITANVTIQRRNYPGGWATAGLLIATGSDNFWNLGLVEGPDGMHYTELVEQYQGVNQAQTLGSSRLIPVSDVFGGEWRYGTVYHLRLTLAPNRIDGYVYEEGRTTPLAHWGYLLGDADAIRSGWAGLRCGSLDATFTEVRVGAPLESGKSARRYPEAKNGCVGIYLGSDMPNAQKAPDLSGFRERLSKAGFASLVLTSEELTSPGTFTYPGLRYFAADMRNFPAQAVGPLTAWMRQGGILVSLTAPAFENLYWRSSGRWMDWNDYVQRMTEANDNQGEPIFAWSDQEIAKWTQVYAFGAQKAKIELKPGATPMRQDAVEFIVPHFNSGWWSANRQFSKVPTSPGKELTCFWAKGDNHTSAMSIEWTEKDGSRWIAVVSLTPSWRFYALPPSAFLYWADNPSKGRGGPGDSVHLDDVDQIHFGLSGSHTPQVLMEPETHHIWLTAPRMETAPPGALAHATIPQCPDLEAVSPGYKLHLIKDATLCKPTALGEAWGLPRRRLSVFPSLGANERPKGDGFNRDRWWRWAPLTSMLDKTGRDRGAPLSVIISGMLPLPRSAWISLGLTRISDLGRSEIQQALTDTMKRLASYPVFYEAGASSFMYRPGETLRVGANLTSFASSTLPVSVLFTVTNHSRKVLSAVMSAKVSPHEMRTVRGTLHSLPEGDYQLTAVLECGGETVDRITQSLLVRPRLSTPPSPKNIVVRKGNGLYLDGKPWHPVSCDYWPHYLGGIPGGAYSLSFLDPTLYEPSVVEADLTQMEKWGFKAIAGVGADAPFGNGADKPLLRDLDDFLWRCQEHHIKVFLYVPGLDPRSRNDAMAKEIIRYVRNNPAIAGYDIAWEPSYYNLRQGYDSHWREWLREEYGDLENAQKVFGYPLPKNAQGEVVSPSDRQCMTNGPWHDMTAAYFSFMNWQLGVEYRRSYVLIKSLDPIHLIGFRGSVVADPQGFLPVAQPAVLHFMDWAGPEGYYEPFYGHLTAWPLISGCGLVTRMLSFLSGGKPVIWMEFGLPIYPNGTTWKDSMIWIKPERYEYQVKEGRQFWTMMTQSGAWGDFIWWYPGGFRVGENSDCGLVDPDNAPRPVASVAREFVPKFDASEHFTANRTLLFKPENDIGGWVGEFDRLRDRYAAILETGHHVSVRTMGVGTTSADCPLIDPAGRLWSGEGPLRFLDSIFEEVRIRAGDGPWQTVDLPTDPKPVTLTLQGAGPIEIKAHVGNIAEAKWLAKNPSGSNSGRVLLSISGDVHAISPLEKDTGFQGSGSFGAVRFNAVASGVPLHLQLQIEAENRAKFGDILDLIIKER